MTRITPVTLLEAGDGITLRPIVPADAPELFALTEANREYLRRWLPWVDGTCTPADTLDFIDSAARQPGEGQGFVTVIVLAGRICGVVGHHGIDWDTRTASLGYWIAESCQGRGIMTRACRAMIRDAFGRLGVEQVTIACATGNRASRAIPERLGFAPVRTVPAIEQLHDRLVDHVVYALDRADWAAREGTS